MPKRYRKVTYRLYPGREQVQGLWLMFHGHRDLYNALLEQRRSAWRRHLSFTAQCEEITRLRAEAPFWQKFNAQSMQVTAKRVDLAFKAFFRRVRQGEKPGFPRFKSLSRFNSWGYKTHGDGWRFTPDTDHRHRIRNGMPTDQWDRGDARPRQDAHLWHPEDLRDRPGRRTLVCVDYAPVLPWAGDDRPGRRP